MLPEAVIDRLQHEFPEIDSTLILALAGDVDTEDELRETLMSLSAAAEASGLDGHIHNLNEESSDGRTNSSVDRVLEKFDKSLSLDQESYGTDSAASLSDSSNSKDAQDPAQAASIAFLKELCPDRSTSFLKKALFDHEGDVEKTLDYVLSLSYIAASTNDNIDKQSQKGIENGQTPEHRKKKRQKRDRKPKQIYSLTSNSPRPSSPATGPSAPEGSSNSWVDVDSMALHLATLLDVNPGVVTSAYYKRLSSFSLCLETLLYTLERERPFEQLKFDKSDSDPAASVLAEENGVVTHDYASPDTPHDGDRVLSVLGDLYEEKPDLRRSDWRRFLCATNGSIENAIDLVAVRDEIVLREGTPAEVGLLKGFDAALHKRLGESQQISGGHFTSTDQGDGSWSSIAARRSRPDPSSRVPFNQRLVLLADPNKASASQCATLAEEYRNQRNEAFHSAARHHQTGKSSGLKGQGDRGAAAYWAERGRELDLKAKQWDMRGARALVEERKVVRDGNTVDLHNLSATQALTVVRENLNTWSNSRNPQPLHIVTGVGKHSANRTPIILPAVEKYLTREGWRFKLQIDAGVFIVTGIAR